MAMNQNSKAKNPMSRPSSRFDSVKNYNFSQRISVMDNRI